MEVDSLLPQQNGGADSCKPYTPENEHGGPQNDAIFEAGDNIGIYVRFSGVYILKG